MDVQTTTLKKGKLFVKTPERHVSVRVKGPKSPTKDPVQENVCVTVHKSSLRANRGVTDPFSNKNVCVTVLKDRSRNTPGVDRPASGRDVCVTVQRSRSRNKPGVYSTLGRQLRSVYQSLRNDME